MQLPHCIFPAPVIDQIVPIGNEVVYGTSGLTERYAAVHAACTLLAQLLFRKVLINLEPVIHPLENRTTRRKLTRVIHEARGLTHGAPALLPLHRRVHLERMPARFG